MCQPTGTVSRSCSSGASDASDEPWGSSVGRTRSGHLGRYQLVRPSRAMVAGTTTSRIKVASIAIAAAMPTPIILDNHVRIEGEPEEYSNRDQPRGVSAGIDAALHLVASLVDEATARLVQLGARVRPAAAARPHRLVRCRPGRAPTRHRRAGHRSTRRARSRSPAAAHPCPQDYRTSATAR